jgi:hypothetical protein
VNEAGGLWDVRRLHLLAVPVQALSGADADYARQAYGARLDCFRKLRRQLDPEDRLMTPFMAQYFG